MYNARLLRMAAGVVFYLKFRFHITATPEKSHVVQRDVRERVVEYAAEAWPHNLGKGFTIDQYLGNISIAYKFRSLGETVRPRINPTNYYVC